MNSSIIKKWENTCAYSSVLHSIMALSVRECTKVVSNVFTAIIEVYRDLELGRVTFLSLVDNLVRSNTDSSNSVIQTLSFDLVSQDFISRGLRYFCLWTMMKSSMNACWILESVRRKGKHKKKLRGILQWGIKYVRGIRDFEESVFYLGVLDCISRHIYFAII